MGKHEKSDREKRKNQEQFARTAENKRKRIEKEKQKHEKNMD